ncbi:dihydrodipicolinate synthase family protein [Paraburkholderia largidicola]|uniref:Dihydrodipicolinate synthase family protein n=1 Tax=Paraburkholderia largidicola TaxID=3014751 RepID=A0A7I8BSB9_9BURK|nr:dihydrodipicolinate synthase family protein [Paraburkholderia sp. PGU16]BCF91081.1 dihydrodipicolinate synthase family protein [Paraburkholderia sp. PGU16]
MTRPAPFSPRGMWPVLYAYFDANNVLDRRAIDTQIDATIDAGASGIVILGLATEVNRLTLDEKQRFIEWTGAHIAGRVPFAVTITGDTADAQLALADYAADHGASSLILQPPSVRDKPESFYFDFFAEVMQRVRVPVGIQNAPEYLGVGLSVESLVTLAAQCGQFQWLKGEGPATIIHSTIERLRERGSPFPVFNGRGGQELIDNLRAGCAGLIVAPDSFDWQAAIHSAFIAGDQTNAQALYERILPSIVFVMQSLDALTCYGKRIAAWRMGFDVAHDRGMRPTAFGLSCARRFAAALGPFADQRNTAR